VGTAQEICLELRRWQEWLTFERLDDVPARAAQLLADGSVIAWAQGRCEFGPRALGNRSILADPRPAANKQIINDLVKKREAYRPFAPSVLIERAREYFDFPDSQDELPFMIFVVKVQPAWRARLGAITHVDGTARIQTVARDVNPRFWALIHEFERLTGIAVVLNTSFNNHAEPIVTTARDAIVCLLTTAIEHLVVGDFLVRKKSIADPTATGSSLIPELPRHRKLVQKTRVGGAGAQFRIDSVKSADFGPIEVEISPELFDVLHLADSRSPLATLFHQAGVRDEATITRVIDECRDLWSRRILVLRPVA
jgi:carbamoyltransferase